MNGILILFLLSALGLVGAGRSWAGIGRWVLMTLGLSILPPTLCTMAGDRCPSWLAIDSISNVQNIISSPTPTDNPNSSSDTNSSSDASPSSDASSSPSPSPSPSPLERQEQPKSVTPCNDRQCACVDYKCLW